jgi:hypothetical protein
VFLMAVEHNSPAAAIWITCSVAVMSLEKECCVSF